MRTTEYNMKKTSLQTAALLLVFVLIIGVCGLFSYRKSGMFVDEIYCYGLSNGYYTPFVKSLAEDSLPDHVLTQQQLFDYLTVGEDDAFAFDSVYYNQTQDVHPPLYYWLFHFASSLTPGILSKWTGLILDFIIYMLALFVLYRLAMELFGCAEAAVSAVAMYGLSTLGLSTMLMIRMYVLLTLLTLLLALWIAELIRRPRPVLYPLIGVTILAGMLCQYYYVFYAFFVCGAYVLYALCKRRWASLLVFSGFAFAGVGGMVLLFPACLDQLFADALVSGGSAVSNLTNFSLYASRLLTFSAALRHGLKAAVLLGLAAAALAVCLSRSILRSFRAGELNLLPLLLILPAFAAFLIVAIASPVDEDRYIYNIVPFFVLAVSFLLWLSFTAMGEGKTQDLLRTGILLTVTMFSLWMARTIPPSYIYPEQAEYNELTEAYIHEPCVYFCDNYNGVVTQDLLQLVQYDDVCFANDPDSSFLGSYLAEKDSDTAVVFVDISAAWGSGYDPDVILSGLFKVTDYTSAERLYQYGLSDTYILSK